MGDLDAAADESLAEIRHLLMALVVLEVEQRELRIANAPNAVKTELLLAAAGLPIAAVAQVVNKSTDAVRKAVARSRGRSPSAAPLEPSGG